jgi:hypothetical protein
VVQEQRFGGSQRVRADLLGDGGKTDALGQAGRAVQGSGRCSRSCFPLGIGPDTAVGAALGADDRKRQQVCLVVGCFERQPIRRAGRLRHSIDIRPAAQPNEELEDVAAARGAVVEQHAERPPVGAEIERRAGATRAGSPGRR